MNGAWETLLRWKDYRGRSTRTEFWMYVLWSYLAIIGFYIFYGLVMYLTGAADGGPINIVFGVLLIVLVVVTATAHLAVAVRRLHDMGLSGWWMLLSLVPIVSLGILVCFCIDSQAGTNRFGPNPKFDDELAATFG